MVHIHRNEIRNTRWYFRDMSQYQENTSLYSYWLNKLCSHKHTSICFDYEHRSNVSQLILLMPIQLFPNIHLSRSEYFSSTIQSAPTLCSDSVLYLQYLHCIPHCQFSWLSLLLPLPLSPSISMKVSCHSNRRDSWSDYHIDRIIILALLVQVCNIEINIQQKSKRCLNSLPMKLVITAKHSTYN